MKRTLISAIFLISSLSIFGQDSTGNARSSKDERREERRQRLNNLIKQQEEGVLIFNKHSLFGIQLRTAGYGIMYELGKFKSPRFANIYKIGISEIFHPAEEKSPNNSSFFSFSNPYKFGKINNFYQVQLGFGQQYILGQKGNRNGVAVAAIADGGLSLGLLRPYYIEVADSGGGTTEIKYEDDPDLFLSQMIIGGTGLSRGWNEMKMKPGAYARLALRFDFGRFNDNVQALEGGVIFEGYASKIPIMALKEDKQLFFQAYISFVFGSRR